MNWRILVNFLAFTLLIEFVILIFIIGRDVSDYFSLALAVIMLTNWMIFVRAVETKWKLEYLE